MIKKKQVWGRSYIGYDSNLLIQGLNGTDWTEFYKETNVDTLWSVLNGKIIGVLDTMCPIKPLRIPVKKAQWINLDIIKMRMYGT